MRLLRTLSYKYCDNIQSFNARLLPDMDPFLKWAGGKRWLTGKNNSILPKKDDFNRYIEPFLGGGSVFFHLKPEKGFLSDLNPDLINSYSVIKEQWEDLYAILTEYQEYHSSAFYYEIRSSKPESDIQKAARFIYLNRTCWNGLYRVNKKGEFNVPIGTKTKIILQEDDFEKLSSVLKHMEIQACDFELTMNKADSGDFIFVDPPYTVKHNLNGFVKYNESIFSWEDQIRLSRSVIKAIDRGAHILVLNAHHESIIDLYKGVGEMVALERQSVIAGKSSARGIFSELAIRCW